MGLDPQLHHILQVAQKKAYPDLSELPVEQARDVFARITPTLDAPPQALWRIEDRAIPGPAGEVPVRVYTPSECAGPLPVLLWLHGGGFVVGGLDTADRVCRRLAWDAQCLVVSVDYRLAPEHKFPAAVEDAYGALEWITAHAGELGGDPERIAIGGDSAGGNLAAVSTILARDAGLRLPVQQLLVYPGTAPLPDSESHRAFAEGYILTRRSVLWFYDLYLRGPADRHDFRYAPLVTPDLTGLPPALMIVAGHDPLRDEDLAYARRLEAAGVEVELALYEGMTHAFFSMSGALDVAKEALARAARTLKAGFASPVTIRRVGTVADNVNAG